MFRLVTALVLGTTALLAHPSDSRDTDFLVPQMKIGDHFSNVFSIASSIKADGFDELVRRNSGSADYTLRQASSDRALTFDVPGVYDGSPIDRSEDIIRDGGATSCWNGKCRVYTDASGLLYNRLLWGDPPTALKAGVVWKVTIHQPWELGPAGIQTVTVMHVDESDGTVTLKREGTASGFFADEPTQVTLVKNGEKIQMDVTPGQAHWTGYTTFRHGIVISDELLVTRADKLTSKETGSIDAARRRYMLLNAAPYPTLE